MNILANIKYQEPPRTNPMPPPSTNRTTTAPTDSSPQRFSQINRGESLIDDMQMSNSEDSESPSQNKALLGAGPPSKEIKVKKTSPKVHKQIKQESSINSTSSSVHSNKSSN